MENLMPTLNKETEGKDWRRIIAISKCIYPILIAIEKLQLSKNLSFEYHTKFININKTDHATKNVSLSQFAELLDNCLPHLTANHDETKYSIFI